MVRRSYVPDAGDLVWASFDPRLGHEQAGRRPGIVISPIAYNELVGLALTCPITSRVKGYPFEVPIVGRRINGVILADQVRSLDWRSREFSFVESSSRETLTSVKQALNMLLSDG